MYIPYRNDAFNSPIDYAKLIQMQSEEVDRKSLEQQRNFEKANKQMVKAKAREERIHRGGRK